MTDPMVVSKVVVTEFINEKGERDWSVTTEPEDMPLVNIIGLLETGKAWLLIDLLQHD